MMENFTYLPYGVIYTEYGFQIIGDVPNTQELEDIKIKSKEHVSWCKKQRNKVEEIKIQYYKNLHEIEHPIQIKWDEFIKTIRR